MHSRDIVASLLDRKVVLQCSRRYDSNARLHVLAACACCMRSTEPSYEPFKFGLE